MHEDRSVFCMDTGMNVRGSVVSDANISVGKINNKIDELSVNSSIKRLSISNVAFNFVKRSFDIVGSLMGMVVLSVPMAIIAFLIFIEDGKNPFYKHMRIGKNGKKFGVLKFRSMMANPPALEDILTPEQMEQYKKEFKIDDDPRITAIGKFIRKTSIDELPQMLNIFLGEMSVIGPRPIVEKELENYNDKKDLLLSVKPGLTGYWQAYARNNATYETGERQEMELFYVENRSLKLDICIFFKTITSVLKQDGAQ